MTHEKMPEALQDMKRRAMGEKDSNGVMGPTYANPREVLSLIAEIERLRAEVEGLRKVRVPLSDADCEEIFWDWVDGPCSEIDLVRAIEAAHGIDALQSTKEQP